MGWFDKVSHAVGKVVDPGGLVSDAYHAVTGAPTEDMKRNMQKQITSQVQAYRDQTELTRNEVNAKNAEIEAAKRQVEEKQIRALRRNYSAQGLLGTQSTDQPDMSNKLGG
jgi:hypothetical protein